MTATETLPIIPANREEAVRGTCAAHYRFLAGFRLRSGWVQRNAAYRLLAESIEAGLCPPEMVLEAMAEGDRGAASLLMSLADIIEDVETDDDPETNAGTAEWAADHRLAAKAIEGSTVTEAEIQALAGRCPKAVQS